VTDRAAAGLEQVALTLVSGWERSDVAASTATVNANGAGREGFDVAVVGWRDRTLDS